MSTSERISKGEDAVVPQDAASTVNLLAHPVAGLAAAGAIGFGLASHALGLWAGAVVGAAEASQRLFAAAQPAFQPANAAPVALKLVVSRSVPEAQAATTTRSVDPAPASPAGEQDDLKAISGVGPKLEKVLNGLGIWSYRQIAALGENDIAWLDDHLGFSGRIGRDDWIGQAKALLASAK
ncbi:NADH-ubiquinone dehydrogenase [Mesorhizobium sp. CAU 1741]|uniref:NADH-ubiquinone dehydrogenase n=1 Tax=Mesorhizobium sp. CAU 1741 TaxID=3140366 RepID=UPI00325B7D11